MIVKYNILKHFWKNNHERKSLVSSTERFVLGLEYVESSPGRWNGFSPELKGPRFPRDTDVILFAVSSLTQPFHFYPAVSFNTGRFHL